MKKEKRLICRVTGRVGRGSESMAAGVGRDWSKL